MCKESTNVRFIQTNLDLLLHLQDNDIHLNWQGKQELANVMGSVVATAVSSGVWLSIQNEQACEKHSNSTYVQVKVADIH